MEQTEETSVNKPTEYELTQEEKEKLLKYIPAYLIMGVGDVSGSHWEDMFSLIKSIPRVKGGIQLYDVIDTEKKIGWSAKTVTTGKKIRPGSTVVANIQHHSSVYIRTLGLTKDSPTELIGKALLNHWNVGKVLKGKTEKGLLETRMCMLVKSKNKTQFAYYESDIDIYSDNEITWAWGEEEKNVLIGTRVIDGVEKYRWTSKCGTLRENIFLPNDLEVFDVATTTVPIKEFIEGVLAIQKEFLEKEQLKKLGQEKQQEPALPAKLSFKESADFWYKDIVGRFNSFVNMVTAKVVTT